ncbi:MAG: hypothetical protein RLZZ267_179 [Bacillota bacterium]|jgi:acyl-[acyl-carrier-protein]-phospholipid O-acyltransferase/long-chain-fatty-acid--[acyl-carrier-protein] ligase
MTIIQKLVHVVLSILHRASYNGFDRINYKERVIIMPNHVSLLDAVFLYALLPKDTVFVSNTQIAEKYKFIMRFTSFITVDQMNPFSIRHMIKVVESGKPLVIFPEGRISVTGGLMKMYSSPSFIATKTGATVYPVLIRGLERSRFSYLNKKNHTVWFPKVSITVGQSRTFVNNPAVTRKQQKALMADQTLQMFQDELFRVASKSNVNLYNELLAAGTEHGFNRMVIEDFATTNTIKDIIVKASVLGGKLHERLLPAERVGVMLPTTPAFAILLFGLFKHDRTPALLNFSMGASTIHDCCVTANLRQIITSRAFIEKGKLQDKITYLEQHVDIIYLEDLRAFITLKDKLAGLFAFLSKKPSTATTNEVVLFTSGSESKPKGVVLTHTNLYANVKQARIMIDLTQQDKFFNALPMFHSFGLSAGTLLPILHGLCTYLYPSPLHYRIVPEMIYDHNCTILLGTSTFLQNWGKAAHPYDFQSLRYIIAGAEQVKAEVRELYMEKFKRGIYEGYGTTEASPFVSCNAPLRSLDGSVGPFFPGMTYHVEPVEGIADGGELWLQGPNLMKGYLLYEEGFKPVGEWYRTGDIVTVNDEGVIHMKARLKRFAKVAGEMISLQQVENVVAQCLGTPEVAAIATGDKRKGEQIIVCTTAPDVSVKQIRDFISAAHLSPLLVPSQVIHVDAIPFLGSGKTDYVTLTDTVAQIK